MCLSIHRHHLPVEIYPREGTETTLSFLALRRSALKFIPVRGRKLGACLLFSHGVHG